MKINKLTLALSALFVPVMSFFAGMAAADTPVNGYKVAFYLLIMTMNILSLVRYFEENY